jgi:hypothetical protein
MSLFLTKCARRLGRALFLLTILFLEPIRAGVLVQNTVTLDPHSLAHNADEAGDRELVTIGDINGDGVDDLAIGIPTAYLGKGAVVIAMMRADGSVQRTFRLASSGRNLPGTLSSNLGATAGFGDAIATLGDLGGGTFSGETVLAIAAPGDAKVLLIALEPTEDGAGIAVSSETDIAFAHPLVVRALANIGDLDGDGVPDLALGQPDAVSTYCPLPASPCGTVVIAFMSNNGSVTSEKHLEAGLGGVPLLAPLEHFGFSLASLSEPRATHFLAVGTPGHAGDSGGLLLLELSPVNFSVLSASRIDQASLSLTSWGSTARFGASLETIPGRQAGEVFGLLVGAPNALDQNGNADAGGLALLSKDDQANLSLLLAVDQASGEVPGAYASGIPTMFGQSIALADVNGDGLPEIFIDAATDSTGNAPSIYANWALDADDDGYPDIADNCPILRNPNQDDSDGDGVGDVCDNCPDISNSDQLNADTAGTGDACEPVKIRLQATGTASAPAWSLNLECGASTVSSLQLAIVPHRSAISSGWLSSMDFGGGCDAPTTVPLPLTGPATPRTVNLGGTGCRQNPSLGSTVDASTSGAFLTDPNGIRAGYPTLRPNSLYLLLEGVSTANGPSLCTASDTTPTFLGEIVSNPAGVGESLSLFLSLDRGLGDSPVRGSGPLATPGTDSIDAFEAITTLSTTLNR